jgi:hypothetical protein
MRYNDRRHGSKLQIYKFINELKKGALHDTVSIYNNIMLFMSLKRWFLNDIKIVFGELILDDINEKLEHFIITIKCKNEILRYDFSLNLDNKYPNFTFFQECENEHFKKIISKYISYILTEIH